MALLQPVVALDVERPAPEAAGCFADRQRASGLPPKDAAEQARRVVIARALEYVANNYDRIDYPRYRKLGLPCSSAPMESAVKQFSRRVKGTEKFWVENGAGAVLQVRAACLSQDDRLERLWARPAVPHAYGSNWRRIAS